MMTFLGMTGYSSEWVEGYSLVVQPLRKIIKEQGAGNLRGKVIWTPEGYMAFERIKTLLQQVPALTLPDYEKPFQLFISCRQNHACGVLTQKTNVGTHAQPIAYYSVALSPVEMGLPECYQNLAAAHLLYEKASALTMGYPIEIMTHHKLVNLLEKGKFVLTAQRLTEYHLLVDYPDVTIRVCKVKNPADSIPLPFEGEPHDCVTESENYAKLRSDLNATPLESADMTLFVDGSCYRDGAALKAGYAIVSMEGSAIKVVQTETCQQPCSAQLAELKALTSACELGEGKRVNIFTDSAYGHGVCHIFGAAWKGRGFRKTDGSPIHHCNQIKRLLTAMMKPKAIAIVKCAAHRKDSSWITRGNAAADEAAKQAASAGAHAIMVTHMIDLEEQLTHKDLLLLQEEVSEAERQLWLQRGASKDSQGLWRNHEGLFAAPTGLLPLLINEAHGLAHESRGEVLRKIREWNFWAPKLQQHVDDVISHCEICLKSNIRRGMTPPAGHIPTPEGPFQHLTIDYVDMIRPVQGKRYMLVVSDRFSRWIEALPAKNKNADTVAKFLCREVFPRFGIPRRISSDNGGEFVDKTVKCVLQKLGVKQRLGCVYHPQSQGMVERANGILKNKLLKICMNTGLNWVDALPLALMAYRGSANKSLKLTPHEALTGRPMPSPVYRAAKGPPIDVLTNDMKSYVKQLSNIHRSIFARINSVQSQTKEEEVPPAVKPGDLVYVKTFRRKWHTPRREGPYEVVNATSTAVQVKGSPTWYHLNHCVKAPADGNEEKTIKEKEKNDHGCQGDESLEGGDEGPCGAGNDNDSTAEFPAVILVEGTGTPTGRET
ncbi:unnamed protein product [Knipowitschia caucasica]